MEKYCRKINFFIFIFFLLILSGCSNQKIDETKYDILYQYEKYSSEQYDIIDSYELYVIQDELYFVGTKNFVKKKNILGFYIEKPPVISYLVREGHEIFNGSRIKEIFTTNSSIIFTYKENDEDFIYLNGDEIHLINYSKQVRITNNTLSIYSNEELLFWDTLDNSFLYNCSEYNLSEFDFVSDCVLYKNKPTFIAQLDGIIYILSIRNLK